MTRYALNLPAQLRHEAEKWAAEQGVSLHQFILWAVAEKVGALSRRLDDPVFPHITYRRGAGGSPVPVLRGTGIRVQTIAIAATRWGMLPQQLATEYGVSVAAITESLAFAAAHRDELERVIAAEEAAEAAAEHA